MTLGATSVWTAKAVAITSAHLAVGGLLWITGVLAAVLLARLEALPTAPRPPAPPPAKRLPRPHEAAPGGPPRADEAAHHRLRRPHRLPRLRRGNGGPARGPRRGPPPPHAPRHGPRRLRHERLQRDRRDRPRPADGAHRHAAAPGRPSLRRRGGRLRHRPLRPRRRRALVLRQRRHRVPRGAHADELRLRLHADEDPLAPLDDRRRDPRRPPAARRLHRRRGRDRRARPRPLRHPLPLADAALLRHRLEAPRGLRRRRLPDPLDRRPHRAAAPRATPSRSASCSSRSASCRRSSGPRASSTPPARSSSRPGSRERRSASSARRPTRPRSRCSSPPSRWLPAIVVLLLADRVAGG